MVENNDYFDREPIKQMSALTENLLRSIDYTQIQRLRKKNYHTLHTLLKDKNELTLNSWEGTFMYPFMIRGGSYIRKELQKIQIYIPMLWPNVLTCLCKGDIEYRLASDILPLPIDQRYGTDEMEYIVEKINEMIGG